MNSKQKLLDSLTAHISIYHSHQTPTQDPNPNNRPAILRWFASLSVHQRRSHLTTVDPNFIKIVLQMHHKLCSIGSGKFIILPDLPQNDDSTLPTLCYRKSEGLLLRLANSNHGERTIRDSVELFSSRENNWDNDTMTLSEGLVENVNQFFEIMDCVSGGRFLRGGEEGEMAADWVELKWLKDKGYYSMEEFIANRFEVSLRLAWLSCNGGKRRGVRLKERLSGAGVAANLFWRKKGCVDWWENLDDSVKKKVLCAYLGKSAKSLTVDVMKNKDCILDGELWSSDFQNKQSRDSKVGLHSKNSSPLDCIFKSLYILEAISTLLVASQSNGFGKEQLFYTSLDSVNSISDIILRKLRDLFMVISLDCTKLELLGEGITNFPKEKQNPNNRKKRGKNRNKKANSVQKTCQDDPKQFETPKVKGDGLPCSSSEVLEKDHAQKNLLSTNDMEPVKGANNGKSRSASRKNRKERKKLKSSNSIVKANSCQPSTSQVGPTVSNSTPRNATIENRPNNTPIVHYGPESNSSLCSSTSAVINPKSGRSAPNGAEITKHGSSKCDTKSGATNINPAVEYNDNSIKNFRETTNNIPKTSPTFSPDQGSFTLLRFGPINSPSYVSSEWPNVAPFHPYLQTHLPTATDRLHLDVGHNWQNHFHRSFLPNAAYNTLLTRPLPMMSSDWPPVVRGINRRVPPTPSGELPDLSDIKTSHEILDLSEDELEAHAVRDCNQFFGGGVMYWNPSDQPMTSFSRPPSLCSDDSSWAWRDADMNRNVDDMVAFSSSYSTNGLTSPSATSFSSHLNFSVADESVSDGEIKTVDSFPYPILRPIIIRERSRSDFRRGYDNKSPCVPRRDPPRIKRPPSPMILCVPPHAPRPPPPTPVNDARKPRGFQTVRSGSSSPRQWGVKGWSHEGVNFEEACLPVDGGEVVWPSWRNKMIPLAGTLLQDRLIAISQLACDQEHPDVKIPLQPPESENSPTRKATLALIHDTLHDEINASCKQVAAENLTRKPYINWAVKRVARSLQVLWPRSRTNVFGSNATGLSLPSSDVDLVVSLPPVRNLEPIKEAGILEGRNGIKETCLQHAARYLANQEWVKSDSLKIVENTAIPIIMLVVEVPRVMISSNMPNVQMPKEESDCVKAVRLDISFKSPTHSGLQTTGLVKDLTERFPAATPLALVLKQFLADRSLDQSYSGGLSSYCLILMITRFLQHEHHLGRPINQNYGSLLMDFLYFFGNVFDPRQMCISIQGSGLYLNRERGCSIDPIYIEDPLFLTNNVGRNCFRIHQCIKAFADAYAMLANELPSKDETDAKPACKLLPKIIPSTGHLVGS